MKIKQDITVRYSETDQMKVVHHSNYAIWFECARTKLIKEMGIPYSELERQGLMLPVLELHVKYIKPAFYEDELEVHAFISSYSLAKLTIKYKVYRKSTMELINMGYSVHACVTTDMKPCDTRKKFPDFYAKLVANCEPDEN